MPYDPRAVANHFLDVARSEDATISPMKMQKLVYFAHGWHLALKDHPLLNEQVEAWAFGPVVRSLYRELRTFGDQPITRKLFDPKTEISDGLVLRLRMPELSDIPKEEVFARALLNRVWNIYSPYTSIQLSNMTHEVGSPWHQVYARYTKAGGQIPKGTDIPPELIRDYFRDRLRTKAEKA